MLKDIVAPKRTVTFGDSTFEVRGLCLEDLAALLENYKTELASLFDGDVNFEVLIHQSPKFVAELIALAADEADQVDVVRKLPLGVQLESLVAAWELTGVEPEMVGNLIRRLTAGMERMNLTGTGTTDKPGEILAAV
jgi:hypothetical protein